MEEDKCPRHPEGGFRHEYIYCRCDLADYRKQKERIKALEADNERLKAEAKMGNIPYAEAIEIKKENESLKKRVEELESPIRLSEKLCKPYEDEIKELQSQLQDAIELIKEIHHKTTIYQSDGHHCQQRIDNDAIYQKTKAWLERDNVLR